METEYRFNTIEELRQSEEHRRLVMCIRKHKVHPTIKSLSEYYFAYYVFGLRLGNVKRQLIFCLPTLLMRKI